ncbi:hypothetical protein [Mycobacterium sp. SMC-17]|uniref:hypothetical protein n=1 Tax=Mycobacterium sp. SMC-17 TaxID=3381628 RepID=UPI003877DD8D
MSDVITDNPIIGFEAVLASQLFTRRLSDYTSTVIGTAVNRILDAHPEPSSSALKINPAPDEPNLVTNLAGVIDRLRGRTKSAGPTNVSATDIAAMSALVRSAFAGRMLRREYDEDMRTALAGALVMAYELAGEQFEEDPGHLFLGELKPPWEIRHPLLLHPAVWLLATACELAMQEGINGY